MDVMNTFTTPILVGGLGWTLTTYALKYLDEVEALYGPPTGQCPYGGVELVPSGKPHIWYAWGKYAVIRLNSSILNSIPDAIFQLSHEVVHVLCDGGHGKVPINLEEGLAAYFSKAATDRDSGDSTYADRSIAASHYQRPFDLVKQLLSIDGNAIKKLRSVQPILGSVSAADFTKAGVGADSALIAELLAPF